MKVAIHVFWLMHFLGSETMGALTSLASNLGGQVQLFATTQQDCQAHFDEHKFITR